MLSVCAIGNFKTYQCHIRLYDRVRSWNDIQNQFHIIQIFSQRFGIQMIACRVKNIISLLTALQHSENNFKIKYFFSFFSFIVFVNKKLSMFDIR